MPRCSRNLCRATPSSIIMAEIVGLVASLFTLIEVASATVRLIHSVTKQRNDCPKELLSLEDEIVSLHGVLVGLKSRAEYYEKTGQIIKLAAFRTLMETPGNAMKTLSASLAHVKKCLREVGSIKLLVLNFRSKETLWHLDRIERLKSLLGLALQSDQSALLEGIEQYCRDTAVSLEKVKYGQKRLADEVAEGNAKLVKLSNVVASAEDNRAEKARLKKREEALDWLSTIDYETFHQDVLDARDQETGHWLWSDSTFEKWLSKPSGMLWIHGIPGAGKTYLFAGLVDRIKDRKRNEQSPDIISYFYFTFRNTEFQEPLKMMASIARQIVSATHPFDLSPDLAALHSECKKTGRLPRLRELEEFIRNMSAKQPQRRIYLLIDALDECVNRSDLLPALIRLKDHVNLLITSRKEPDLWRAFSEKISGQISIQNDQVAVDIAHYIQQEFAKEDLQRLSDNLKDHVKDTLVQGANGMFRWVKCQLDVIRALKRDKAVRQALNNLPKTLDETYERVLVDVINQDPSDENEYIARRVFQCVAYTHEPMTVAELAEAVVVEPDQEKLDIEARFNNNLDVTELCTSLIQVSSLGTVSFSHYSVLEYLRSERIKRSTTGAERFALKTDESDVVLGDLCLTYLTFEDFRVGPCGTVDDYVKKIDYFPFLEYAARNWLLYAKSIGDGGKSLVKQLSRLLAPGPEVVQPKLLLASALQAGWHTVPMHTMPRPGDDYKQIDRERSNSYIDETNQYAKGYIKRQPTETKFNGMSFTANSFLITINLRLAHLVDPILKAGADINAMCGAVGNPLHLAAEKGYTEMVKLLLDRGADIEAYAWQPGRTPLVLSLFNGHWDTAQVLLQRGADATITPEYPLDPPLYYAVQRRANVEMIGALIDAGADINYIQPVPEGRSMAAGTFLDKALANGLEWAPDIVEYLTSRGALTKEQLDSKASEPEEASVAEQQERLIPILE